MRSPKSTTHSTSKTITQTSFATQRSLRSISSWLAKIRTSFAWDNTSVTTYPKRCSGCQVATWVLVRKNGSYSSSCVQSSRYTRRALCMETSNLRIFWLAPTIGYFYLILPLKSQFCVWTLTLSSIINISAIWITIHGVISLLRGGDLLLRGLPEVDCRVLWTFSARVVL